MMLSADGDTEQGGCMMLSADGDTEQGGCRC